MTPEELQKQLIRALGELHESGWGWASIERWYVWTKVMLGEICDCAYPEWNAAFEALKASGQVESFPMDHNLFRIKP